MARANEWLNLARAMKKSKTGRILVLMFIMGALLIKVGVIGWAINSHNKAFYYVMLSGVAIWILFLCSAAASDKDCFRYGASVFTFCILLVVFLGIATGIVFPLVSEYNRDNKVNFRVTDPTLSQFNISGTNLEYNLTVKVVVGPNRKNQGVYYGDLQAWASYQGHNFTTPLSLPPFSLGGKSNHSYNSSTVVLQPLVFQGRRDQLVLTPDALKRYQQDQAVGRFSIDVTLSYAGFRGHHQLKGMETFPLEELPLPNSTSGWSEHTSSTVALGTVVGCIVVLAICPLWLLCILLVWCAWEHHNSESVKWCLVCMLLPLIQIAIAVPVLVRALKTSNHIQFRISNATLTQFDFPSAAINDTLAYDLSLAITIGPNKEKTGVYLDKMEAVAYYQGRNFTSLSLSPLYLQGKQQHGYITVILRPVLQGQQVLVLTGDGLKHYKKETASRRYNILVTLSYSGIRTDNAYNSSGTNGTSTMEAGNGNRLKRTTSFELRVPLLANASSGTHMSSDTGSGGIFCFDRQHDATLSALILGFLAYGLLCLH